MDDGKQPELILMAGYPGVGKSAISVELAKELGYALLDIDDILAQVDALSQLDDWELRGRLAYNILKALVARQIGLGVSIVVDTPLTHQWLRDFMFATAHTHGTAVHVVYCQCPDALAIERNRMRLAEDPVKYAGRDSDNFHRIKRLFQPIEPIAGIQVSTELPVAANVERIVAYIEQQRRVPGSR